MNASTHNPAVQPHLQIWWPKPETVFPSNLSDILHGIRKNTTLQTQIMDLATAHQIRSVRIGCRHTDSESPAPSIDIFYIRRGIKPQENCQAFEDKLETLLRDAYPSLPSRGDGVSYFELRAGRANYLRRPELLSRIADLVVDSGVNPYQGRGGYGG